MWAGYKIDMYTLPPYLMVIIIIFSCFIMWTLFRETYAGIIDENEQDGLFSHLTICTPILDKNMVIPSYDLPPALVCIWLWVCSCMISTNIEVSVHSSRPFLTVVSFQSVDSPLHGPVRLERFQVHSL